MTIQAMFYSVKKYGFVQDGDNLPPREWADGQMHEKVNGEWQVVNEEKDKKCP